MDGVGIGWFVCYIRPFVKIGLLWQTFQPVGGSMERDFGYRAAIPRNTT
jgi:hypothetical protein